MIKHAKQHTFEGSWTFELAAYVSICMYSLQMKLSWVSVYSGQQATPLDSKTQQFVVNKSSRTASMLKPKVVVG